jgi:hypothetical protein
VFVATIDEFLVNSGRRQASLLQQKLIESYKDRILVLEIEIESVRHDKEEFKNLLFSHLGLIDNRTATNDEERQVIHKPMSPLRMRSSLQDMSKAAVRNKE